MYIVLAVVCVERHYWLVVCFANKLHLGLCLRMWDLYVSFEVNFEGSTCSVAMKVGLVVVWGEDC